MIAGGMGMARQAAGGFNPLGMTGLLYLTHTDDSTVSGTQVTGIADRLVGYAWSQATSTARPVADTTTVAGHKVWKFNDTTRRWLDLADATPAGGINGTPAFTFGAYMKVVSHPTGDATLMGHTISTSSYNPAIRGLLRGSTAGGGFSVIESNASITAYQQSSSGSPVSLPDTGWHFYAFTYDGVGTCKFWADGVQVGPSATGTDRSPTALTHVTLGDATTPAGTREFYTAGYLATTGQMTSAQMISYSSWYAATLV